MFVLVKTKQKPPQATFGSTPCSVRLILWAIEPSVRSLQLLATTVPFTRTYGIVAWVKRVLGLLTLSDSHAL